MGAFRVGAEGVGWGKGTFDDRRLTSGCFDFGAWFVFRFRFPAVVAGALDT